MSLELVGMSANVGSRSLRNSESKPYRGSHKRMRTNGEVPMDTYFHF